jgi:hypothetical protein
MNLLIKKINSDKEYLLYETLKFKKKLEAKYLDGNFEISRSDFRLIFKGVLLTNEFSFVYKRNIIELINIIEEKLNRNYSNFKIQGDKFIINNIGQLKSTPIFFEQLIKFNIRLEKQKSSLVIQGSYADQTFISYSDIDLVIIGYLTQEVIVIKKELEELILTIDPLQHHGVFFINMNSFKNYWQMDLPINTLKKSLILSQTSTLNISMPSVFQEKISSFNWIYNFAKNYPTLPINMSSGVFFSKYFLSQLLLVPTLLLAIKGDYIYKRDSFVLAKKYYTREAWQCIHIVSSIRINWNQNFIDLKYITNRNNSTVKDVIEYNILSDVINIEKDKLDELASIYISFINETMCILNNTNNEV